MDMRIVGGEPVHAEDNLRVWCLDEPKLEDSNLQGGSLVGNQALQEKCPFDTLHQVWRAFTPGWALHVLMQSPSP